LIDKKKIPVHPRDKVVSLGDISIYTETDDVPLKNILLSMKQKENGEKSSVAPNSKPEELKKYFEEVLPEFDKDRVYPTDIKKMISWYNILIESGIDFETEEKVTGEETKE
jgi:hypothetical protein